MTDLRKSAILRDMAELLTTAQAAERLGKSISTVIYRVRIGELSCAQKLPGLSGAYLFDPAVIEAARLADEAKSTSTTSLTA